MNQDLKQKKNEIMKMLCKQISQSSTDLTERTKNIEKLLVQLSELETIWMPKRTVNGLFELSKSFDWSLLKYPGAYKEKQIDRFVRATCYVMKVLYYNGVKLNDWNRHNEGLDEQLLEDLDGLFHEREGWFNISCSFSSTKACDAPGNVLRFLELNGLITKTKDAIKIFSTGYGRCATYRLEDKFFELYDGEKGEVELELPDSYCSVIKKKVLEISKYEEELLMMANTFMLQPSKEDIKVANIRLAKQKELNKKLSAKKIELVKEGKYDKDEFAKEKEQEIYKLNGEIGMDLSTAVVLLKINDATPSIILMCSNDNYSSRFYHPWTSIPAKIRERAQLREEFKAEFKNSNLVEIDLSQSCMYFIFIEYLKYCEKNGIKPTKHLTKAVFAGKLREYICINAVGKFVRNGKFDIDFDEIKTISDYEKNKDVLKKFCMLGLNCGTYSDAAWKFDLALEAIDPNFAKFIREERKGWWNDCTTKSTVPFKTLANEVEFMLGLKTWHKLPTDNTKLTQTESTVTKSENKSVVKLMVEKGVKFFLTIHDAIIVTEDDVEKVYESLREAARIRCYLFAPCAKITHFDSNNTINHCYNQETGKRFSIGGTTTVPLRTYMNSYLPKREMYWLENCDKFYYMDLIQSQKYFDRYLNKEIQKCNRNYTIK